MDFSRRGFLNLLGIGGIGLAMADRPALALFGSDDAPKDLIVPDHSLVGGHYVVHPKRFIERVPPAERKSSPYGTVVARLTKHMEPTKPFIRREGRFQVRPRTPDGALITEGHTAYYTAAMEIREKFAVFSRETLAEVDPELRPMLTLVTIADAPIHARPVGVWGDDSYAMQVDRPLGDNDRGFDVVAHFRQFAVIGAQRNEVDTFQMYSETGEFPLQVPKDVEMGMLLRIDREVVAAGANTPDRVSDLLSRFSRSWLGKTA
jgi:hypothetical protein